MSEISTFFVAVFVIYVGVRWALWDHYKLTQRLRDPGPPDPPEGTAV